MNDIEIPTPSTVSGQQSAFRTQCLAHCIALGTYPVPSVKVQIPADMAAADIQAVIDEFTAAQWTVAQVDSTLEFTT